MWAGAVGRGWSSMVLLVVASESLEMMSFASLRRGALGSVLSLGLEALLLTGASLAEA